MAASFNKRRGALRAILKNHLAIVVPMFYTEGLISDEESRVALDDYTSINKRADSLVAVVGSKIEMNEELLKDVLRILREADIARTYVTIIEEELHDSQRSGKTTASNNKDRQAAIDQSKERQHIERQHIESQTPEQTSAQQEEVEVHIHVPSQHNRHLVSGVDTLNTPRPTSSGHPHLAEGSQSHSQELELTDIRAVTPYLRHLQIYELIRLGKELHLNYTNLVRMKHTHTQRECLLEAVLEAWLLKEDNACYFPPTWRRLSTALRKIGQSYVAKKIMAEKVNQH